MADVKITALTAISSNPVNPATFPIPMVDLLDNLITASGTTKKVTVNQILGSGGTATLASATITGAATVGTTLGVTGVSTFAAGTALLPALTTTGDTNTGIYYPAADTFAVTTAGVERYRVDSTGLGVGTTNYIGKIQAAGLIAAADPTFGSSGTFIGAILNNDNTAPGLDLRRWTGSAANHGTTYISTDATGATFFYNGTQTSNTKATSLSMTLDASGNLLVGVTSANANGGVLQLKSGITFPATQVAASDANTLDDYEEGTWTPVAVSLTVVGSVTYPVATYTKIGRVVYINLKVAASTSSTSTENVTYFTGLPFTPTVNSTVTAVNEQNVGSLGVGLFAANARLYSPTWTAIANANLSGFYYV